MMTRPDTTISEPAQAVVSLRTDLRMSQRDFGDKRCYVVEDPLRGKFYRLGLAEYRFATLLDGRRTIAQAVAEAARTLGEQAFTENEALAICRWLLESQLAIQPHAVESQRLLNASAERSKRPLAALANPFVIRVPLVNPARLLGHLAPWGQWLFTAPGLALWAALCGYAIYLAWLDGRELISGAAVLLDPSCWWMFVSAWVALKFLHEACHGLACRKYGGEVRQAGLMVLLFAPVPYVDVTSSWRFANKWERVVTAAAGMYVELLLAAIAMIVWANCSAAVTRQIAFNVALTASVGTILVNANPLMRFDGYYILSDVLEIPNLAAEGQRWLVSVWDRAFGVVPAATPWSGRKRAIIAAYSILAFAWRALVIVVLVLALAVIVGRVDARLAAAMVVAVAAWLVVRAGRRFAKYVHQHPVVSRPRIAALAGAMAACLALVAWLVMRPTTVAAYGVADYAPLTVVRADSPGFVRQVLVADGQTVKTGEPLVVLENQELATELREIELQIQQSVLRGRGYQQNGDIAKEQAEAANQAALEKRRVEKAAQLAALTVRAPVASRVVARNLEMLEGQYLSAGKELLVLGNEDRKEIVLAVPQHDLELFTERIGSEVAISLIGRGGQRLTASLDSVDPRAESQPPHAALSASNGGPLPIQVVSDPANETEQEELYEPCFKATVALSAVESSRLRAGELARVAFRAEQQSWGARVQAALARWFERQVRLAGEES